MTTTIATCEEHRHLTKRLERDLAGWLLKHADAMLDLNPNCVVCK